MACFLGRSPAGVVQAARACVGADGAAAEWGAPSPRRFNKLRCSAWIARLGKFFGKKSPARKFLTRVLRKETAVLLPIPVSPTANISSLILDRAVFIATIFRATSCGAMTLGKCGGKW